MVKGAKKEKWGMDMSKFNQYFLMNAEVIKTYAKERLDIFTKTAVLTSKEIGDGNLNYVFRVWEEATGKSVIVKQAGPVARISPDIKIATDRNRIEAEILMKQNELAPGLVPIVYDYDEVMSCCCMEDLSEYDVMRTALMRHEIFPEFAEHISTFMVNTLLLTSDVCMDHKVKKNLVKNYINPELCEITEDLVYTEPYHDIAKRNNVYPPNAKFVKQELYEDQALHLEVAKCKFDFMNHAQALLHGDLHTGSIFIKQGSTKIFDPEFAFYGPIGYDIGNVIANMLFAWNNGNAVIEDAYEKDRYLGWIESSIMQIIDLFITKYNSLYEAQVKDVMAKTSGFKNWYLEAILSDAAAVTGLELIRRTVGLANVKDITVLPEKERILAERICICLAKNYIMNRKQFKSGGDFVSALKTAVEYVTA
ncbi:MAG: S-methyl-5-thioribose kinase [Cellulosilyticaceae bacterium]